jgi:hypothetical protein
MDVERGVDQMRVVPVALADRTGLPLVEACFEKPRTRRVTATGMRSAARSRTSGNNIWEGVAGEVGRGPMQDLILLIQLLDAPTPLADLELTGPCRTDVDPSNEAGASPSKESIEAGAQLRG